MRKARAQDIDEFITCKASPENAFGVLRETLTKTGMPWSPKSASGHDFNAHYQSRWIKDATIGRISSTSHVVERNRQEIERSAAEGYWLFYSVSGGVQIEQADRRQSLRSGNIAIIESWRPAAITSEFAVGNNNLWLFIPRRSFASIGGAEARFCNLLLPHSALMSPLSLCMTALFTNFTRLSQSELSALYEASVALVPAAAGLAPEAKGKRNRRSATSLKREILDYLHDNIADPDLSPHGIAASFGISERYFYRLFASLGTTFSEHTKELRLMHVRSELACPAKRHQPISALAFAWGFRDISTFNKAFKSRFGCTPRALRSSLGSA